tara:strand:+ start:334 stop:603 length:270 start_codon:yes stop_codon:yes gene_type:complete
MAIEKTTVVQEIRVRPAVATGDATLNSNYPTIQAEYRVILDDSTDDDLPVTSYYVREYYKLDADGGSAYDYAGSSLDALVKAVAAGIYA